MPLAAGTRLGPYEIIGPLSAGSKGEVYSARDTRLWRKVALKVLGKRAADDEQLLKRFVLEARAAGLLSHPNIVVVHDVGTDQGLSYLVSELLEGATLRERLRAGPVPQPEAIDFGLQIARGLAAAHERGIVHRDLEPGNLFVTREGRVKIFDFGLVKLVKPAEGASGLRESQVVHAGTKDGALLGTVGYMAPEQVRGETVDPRTDLFAAGAILYEMLTGMKAFTGDSSVEVMEAILTREPVALSAPRAILPANVDRLVRRCLAKKPEDRFQSANDLAFEIEALAAAPNHRVMALAALGATRLRRYAVGALLAVAFVAIPAVAFFVGRRAGGVQPPSFRRLTFQRGIVWSARFAPDARTAVYSASCGGDGVRVFSTRLESRESRPLGLPDADVQAISSSGEMAVLLHPRGRRTLARLSSSGGVPRELLGNVSHAEWSPSGASLLVVRTAEGRQRLEFPLGKLLVDSIGGWIGSPRFSPQGDRIAFLDHPAQDDRRGTVVVVDLAGVKRMVGPQWKELTGLAWSPRAGEVWISGSEEGARSALWAVDVASGRTRPLTSVPASLHLKDVSRAGSVLLTRETQRLALLVRGPGDTRERDLSWSAQSALADLSIDGKAVLFQEEVSAKAARARGSAIYLRKTDGSAALRLGEGTVGGLSPDGRWAVAGAQNPMRLMLLPTARGEPLPLPLGNVQPRIDATMPPRWARDGKRVVFAGQTPGRPQRLYALELGSGQPSPITPEGVAGPFALSPDGTVAVASQERVGLYPLAAGGVRAVAGLEPGLAPVAWSADGRSLFLANGTLPARIFEVDVATGGRRTWRSLSPADPTGLVRIAGARVSPGADAYAYNEFIVLSDLYLVEGLR